MWHFYMSILAVYKHVKTWINMRSTSHVAVLMCDDAQDRKGPTCQLLHEYCLMQLVTRMHDACHHRGADAPANNHLLKIVAESLVCRT